METSLSQKTVGNSDSRLDGIPLREQILHKLSLGYTITQTEMSLKIPHQSVRYLTPDIYQDYLKKGKLNRLKRRVRIIEFWVGNGYCDQRAVAKRLREPETYVGAVISSYLPTPPADRTIITLKSKV